MRKSVATYDKMLREARERLDQVEWQTYLQQPLAEAGRRHD